MDKRLSARSGSGYSSTWIAILCNTNFRKCSLREITPPRLLPPRRLRAFLSFFLGLAPSVYISSGSQTDEQAICPPAGSKRLLRCPRHRTSSTSSSQKHRGRPLPYALPSGTTHIPRTPLIFSAGHPQKFQDQSYPQLLHAQGQVHPRLLR